MATWYVRSGATGAGTGADWANAYTTLKASAEAAGTAAGDTHYVAEDHAETQGSALSITFKGTPSARDRVLCVSHTGSVPPVAADLVATPTGSVTTTGNFGITLTGCAIFEGIIWNCGSGVGSPDFRIGGTTHSDLVFKNGSIRQLCTSGPTCTLGGATGNIGYKVTWLNTTYQVGSALASLLGQAGVEFTWKDTPSAILGATLPNSLFGTVSNGGMMALVEGVDLSALTGKNLTTGQRNALINFSDCKLPSSYTLAASLVTSSSRIFVSRSANGATAYSAGKTDLRGAQTTETTIVRTGGDTNNGTPVAIKVTTTANASRDAPFECIPIAIPNTAVGSALTATVYGIWGGAAVPTNAECWIEVGYLGDATAPIRWLESSEPATSLTTPTNNASDTSPWGGSTTKFKMTVSITPAMAGDVYVKICCGKASDTFYFDSAAVLQ